MASDTDRAPVATAAEWPVTTHYISPGGAVEAIDVIEAFELGYRLGNVIKYVLRADRKGKALSDLKKARDYLSREIAMREAAAPAVPRDPTKPRWLCANFACSRDRNHAGPCAVHL